MKDDTLPDFPLLLVEDQATYGPTRLALDILDKEGKPI